MAAVKTYKEHRQFTGQPEWVEILYDFAVDGGTTAAKDLIKFPEAMVLLDCMTKVDTACLGSSSTLIWGVSGNTDSCLGATAGAVANLTAGAVIAGDAAGKQLKMAAAEVISMTIGTAAFTAGKVRFCMLVQKF